MRVHSIPVPPPRRGGAVVPVTQGSPGERRDPRERFAREQIVVHIPGPPDLCGVSDPIRDAYLLEDPRRVVDLYL